MALNIQRKRKRGSWSTKHRRHVSRWHEVVVEQATGRRMIRKRKPMYSEVGDAMKGINVVYVLD